MLVLEILIRPEASKSSGGGGGDGGGVSSSCYSRPLVVKVVLIVGLLLISIHVRFSWHQAKSQAM